MATISTGFAPKSTSFSTTAPAVVRLDTRPTTIVEAEILPKVSPEPPTVTVPPFAAGPNSNVVVVMLPLTPVTDRLGAATETVLVVAITEPLLTDTPFESVVVSKILPPEDDNSLVTVSLPAPVTVTPLDPLATPATVRSVFEVSARLPLFTAKSPTAVSVFAVPARLTSPPVTDEPLASEVVATIVPFVDCAIPLVADKSTVAPDSTWPAFNTIAPPCAVNFASVAGFTVPVPCEIPPLAVRSTVSPVSTWPTASPIAPLVDFSNAAPVAVAVPATDTAEPVSPMSVALRLPVNDKEPLSTIPIVAPPAIVPDTVKFLPFRSENPAAAKEPNVAIWFAVAEAPFSVVADLPDPPLNVPAITVPVSPIVPAVAVRLTVPAPPSVTVPGMVMLAPFNATAAALTVPEIVNPLSVVRLTPDPLALPTTSTAPVAASCNVPVAAKSPSFEATLVDSVKVTVLATPARMPVVFKAAPTPCVIAPEVRRSTFVAPASNPPATEIPVATVVGLTLPNGVIAPTRIVPAVMPTVFVSERPDAAPSVSGFAPIGASSNTPVPTSTTPLAPVTPSSAIELA